MDAIAKVASIKTSGMKPWKQALFIDHYLAACVHLGGARRSARAAVKSWRDRDVVEFIDIKRGGFLWSANNSISVDADFWKDAREPRHTHARRVFEAAVNAAYWDKTGEPGFINVDMLNQNREGMDAITGENMIDQEVYVDLHRRTKDMIENVLDHVKKLYYVFIPNPCFEIVMALYGAYCVIGDVCLANARTLDEALDAAGLMARFLVRCNLMRADYAAEVKRTNRIGVSLTGIHEFAWNLFGLTFHDMIDYYYHQGDATHVAFDFWNFVDRMRERVEHNAAEFSIELGMVVPHTNTTIKPAGTVSKPLVCTEGGHLPAYVYYLRWNQYQNDDPEVANLVARGYPMEDIGHRYPRQVIVGFPTTLPIAALMGDAVTCAGEATMEEQFRWLMLLERHWLGEPQRNNQISYTLKYDAENVSYQQFMDAILEWQPKVRCCAVMPQSDWRESKKIYGYVPEQPITKAEYEELMSRIATPVEREGYDDSALACESGVCPIELDRV
jgi:hypothetical protein